MAKIIAVCRSDTKGVRKTPVDSGVFKVGLGMEGDAHAGGDKVREVSLLAQESIAKMNLNGHEFKPGEFAENITTSGISLVSLPVGTRLRAGEEVTLEITQIGKKCHSGCVIMKEMGICVMPREGVFARVVRGGCIKTGDQITILPLR
ncbi:MAG: MOSC domain-containing protein [Dehalococcoidia bacterium]|nr:MOSC domain-containing protein [Dehalococcoidia bacterium]